MTSCRTAYLCVFVIVAIAGAALYGQTPATSAAQLGLEKLKALEGDWIDVDGVFGKKGTVAVTYRVTSGGHAVVETFPVNTPGEMVTTYHLDGNELVLTHFCTSANQPRMRSKGLEGNTLAFDFDGGANIDPARTAHMHSAKIDFISADEIRGTWQNWRNGKATARPAVFRVVRKK